MAARTTTQRGLGWRHRQVVEQLKARHHDGSPCWWCGRGMWLDDTKNWDERTLAGDHTDARAHNPTSVADRLLHSTCNSERGDGTHDDQRPALTGQAPAHHGDRQQWCRLSW